VSVGAALALVAVATACYPRHDPPSPAPGGTATAGITITPADVTPPTTTTTSLPPPPVYPSDFPDPFVLPVGGSYYAYATGSGFSVTPAAKSTDLVHWTYLPDIWGDLEPFTGTPPDLDTTEDGSAWAELFASTWGPAVLPRPSAANPSQRYVLYYAAKPEAGGAQCIGRATGPSPEGPFIDANPTALICQPSRGGAIDPQPFVANGKLYLLWKSEGVAATGEPTRIWSTPLSADGLALAGGSAQLLQTLAWSWEPPIIEAPSMIPAPRNNGYLLFYSANQWQTANYKVAVAFCTTPTSPCKRMYNSPLVASRGGMLGPGGASAFRGADGRWYLAFHSWTSPNVGYHFVPDPLFGQLPDPRYSRSLRVLPISFPFWDNSYPKVG
jgi:beta-xylosidase